MCSAFNIEDRFDVIYNKSVRNHVIQLIFYGDLKMKNEKKHDITQIAMLEDSVREDHRDAFSFRAFPELIDCVRSGDPQRLRDAFTEEVRRYYEEAIPDHAFLPYLFAHLCGCNLMISYEGGLSLSTAAAISSKYLNLASAIRSVDEFVIRLQDMQMDFAEEVALARRFSSGHHTVDQCMHYIHEHVNEKIELKCLSAVSGYSLSRLQHVFAQYAGISLTAFIRKEKIRKACFLLNHTEDSAAAISQKLSYCSQSYFINQFKAETGMTPAAYRRKGHHGTSAAFEQL